MYVVPEVDEVVSAAERLGMHFDPEEAMVYQRALVDELRMLDAFVQSHAAEEARPPLVYSEREPGHPPTEEEDPLNAWLWKSNLKGASDGVLAGKTVSFKDHTAVAGIPLTFGSFAMDGFIPDFDATIVTRVLEAGGVVVGKNTMDGPSGGFGFGGSIGDYGRPKNPHNLHHVAGGTSSGSAVAVAASEVDVSFGGDQGGSIRIPAAWSGTLGLKPTFGLVSHFGIGFGADQSIDHVGPLTRTVEDAAAALQAVAGYDGLDPRQNRAVPDRVDALSTLTEGVSGLRLGILTEGFEGAEPDVGDLVMAAIEVLAEQGAHVSTVSIPEHLTAPRAAAAIMMEGSLAIFNTGFFGAFAKTYYPPSLIAAINKMWSTQADLLGPRVKFRYLLAEFSKQNYGGRAYAVAQNMRPTFVRAYDAALADVDALVMPTCIMKAPKYSASDDYLAGIESDITLLNRGYGQNSHPFNYTGHPALAIPCGKSGGLPVSMQIAGRFFDDPLLLRVAYTYQQSVDWDEVIRIGSEAANSDPEGGELGSV